MQRAKRTAELVDWFNALLDEQYLELHQLRSGVSLVQVFHCLYPDQVKLNRLKFADGLHNWQANLKLLQQVLRDTDVDHSFNLSDVLDKKKHELFNLANWVRTHYAAVLKFRSLDSLEYDAKEHREKARAWGTKRSVRRTSGADDNVSDSSGATLDSSCFSGRSSSTNYLSSYNKNRARKYPLPAGKWGTLQAPTRSSASKDVFAQTHTPRVGGRDQQAPRRPGDAALELPIQRSRSAPHDDVVSTSTATHTTADTISVLTPAPSVEDASTSFDAVVASLASTQEDTHRASPVDSPLEVQPPSAALPSVVAALLVVTCGTGRPGSPRRDQRSEGIGVPIRQRGKGKLAITHIRAPSYRQRKQRVSPQTTVVSVRPSNALQVGDFIPSKGLLPTGFNFIDPSTWSGQAETTSERVHGWDALQSDHFLDQLTHKTALSPSVYVHASSDPQTPATIPGTPSALLPRYGASLPMSLPPPPPQHRNYVPNHSDEDARDTGSLFPSHPIMPD